MLLDRALTTGLEHAVVAELGVRVRGHSWVGKVSSRPVLSGQSGYAEMLEMKV